MTRKSSAPSILLVLVSLAAIAGLSACTQGPIGIFASISQETDINASRTKAFDGANASFVGQLGSTYYAIVGQGIFYKRSLNGDWTTDDKTNGIRTGLSDPYAQSAAVAGATLYAVLGENNPSIYSYDGTTRTLVNFAPADQKIVRVLAAGAQLFVITEQLASGDRTGKYFIHSYDGSTFTQEYDGSVAGAEISLPNSVTVNGSSYWFDGGDKVITGTLGNLVVTTAAPPYKVTGVVHHAGAIYASSSKGRILATTTGATWSASPTEFKNNNSVAINFTAPRIISSAGTDVLLVGTTNGEKQNAGNGYYEIDPADLTELSPRVISTETNFDTSLNGKSVIGMPHFVEGGGIRVFGLTVKDGLWSNYFNGSSWSGWARE